MTLTASEFLTVSCKLSKMPKVVENCILGQLSDYINDPSSLFLSGRIDGIIKYHFELITS